MEQWARVEHYLTDLLVGPDPALEAALEAGAAAGLPRGEVSPSQGKLLELLARIQGARAILEIGTLGGYSTIWLARALPPGRRLITLEVDASYARSPVPTSTTPVWPGSSSSASDRRSRRFRSWPPRAVAPST